jgi:hypothetical protein
MFTHGLLYHDAEVMKWNFLHTVPTNTHTRIISCSTFLHAMLTGKRLSRKISNNLHYLWEVPELADKIIANIVNKTLKISDWLVHEKLCYRKTNCQKQAKNHKLLHNFFDVRFRDPLQNWTAWKAKSWTANKMFNAYDTETYTYWSLPSRTSPSR